MHKKKEQIREREREITSSVKRKLRERERETYTRTELMMFLCKTNSIFCASLNGLLLFLLLLL